MGISPKSVASLYKMKEEKNPRSFTFVCWKVILIFSFVAEENEINLVNIYRQPSERKVAPLF